MSLRLGSSRVWRVVLGVVAVLSGAAMIPLALLASPAGSVALGNLVIAAAIGIPCAAVGYLVARRQPGNPLGWLFLVIAICLFLSTDGGEYAAVSYLLRHHLPFSLVGPVLDDIWGPSLVLFALVILLFPDGRLPSARWRWALRAYLVVFTAFLAATAAALTGKIVEAHNERPGTDPLPHARLHVCGTGLAAASCRAPSVYLRRSSHLGSCSSRGARPCHHRLVSGVSRWGWQNRRIALARSSRYQRNR